jgi:membrane protease YdiL (CAAX protease family)
METTLAVLGGLAEAGAWVVVVVGRRNLWAVLTPALVAMGIAALATGEPSIAPRASAGAAALAGVGAGVALYLATRAFVAVVTGWRAFRAQAARLYLRREPLSLPAVVLLAAVLSSGEELFWRGLVQPRLSAGFDSRTAGAALSYGAFVLANLPSANLAIVAGAVVGGVVWALLGWWTGGVLASLLCHVTWTSLMVALPVVPSDPESVRG